MVPVGMLAYLGYLVISQASNVPFWDQWNFVDVFAKYYQGTLGWNDLTEPHNGHIIFFPKLIMLAMGIASHWDVRYELAVNLFLVGCLYSCYRLLLLKQTDWGFFAHFFIALVIGLLLFSYVQCENWTWGWQLQMFLCLLLVPISLGILSCNAITTRSVIVTALLTLCASFSYAAALNVWLVGGFLLAIRAAAPRHLALWLSFAIPCIGFYIFKDMSDRNLVVQDPLMQIKFILVFLGTPLGLAKINNSYHYGMVGLMAATFVVYAAVTSGIWKRPIILFFLSILVFTVMSAVLTSLARAEVGGVYGNESRLTSVSVHFWIALIVLMFICIREIKPNGLVKTITLASALVFIFSALHTSLEHKKYLFKYEERTAAMNRLMALTNQPGETFQPGDDKILPLICWDKYYLLEKAFILKKYGLSFYHTPE